MHDWRRLWRSEPALPSFARLPPPRLATRSAKTVRHTFHGLCCLPLQVPGCLQVPLLMTVSLALFLLAWGNPGLRQPRS